MLLHWDRDYFKDERSYLRVRIEIPSLQTPATRVVARPEVAACSKRLGCWLRGIFGGTICSDTVTMAFERDRTMAAAPQELGTFLLVLFWLEPILQVRKWVA